MWLGETTQAGTRVESEACVTHRHIAGERAEQQDGGMTIARLTHCMSAHAGRRRKREREREVVRVCVVSSVA